METCSLSKSRCIELLAGHPSLRTTYPNIILVWRPIDILINFGLAHFLVVKSSQMFDKPSFPLKKNAKHIGQVAT
jgi:hypothetical protein